MKCKWKECNNEARRKSVFCCGTCKKRYSRLSGTIEPLSGTDVSVGPQVGQRTAATMDVVIGSNVYGRQAVRYIPDQWATRPEPLDLTDIPHSGGRGKYTRQDGSEYQFDSKGSSFDLTNGLVYQTVEEVRACYA